MYRSDIYAQLVKATQYFKEYQESDYIGFEHLHTKLDKNTVYRKTLK